jgi:hypothetical protein
LSWSDELDAIFAGDLTVGLGYLTPAGGVVVQAVAPIGLCNRERGTLGFTTSLGFSKKLERIAADPRVALSYHTRAHGRASGNEYVLAQGTATVIEKPTEAQRKLVREKATAHLGPPKEGLFWSRWLRQYYEVRVPVEVAVTRIFVGPGIDAAESPAPQTPPKNGTGPRIDVARAAKRLRGTEHTLLGYADADGAPLVVPVTVGGDDANGITLTSTAALPPGGRRAGLLGHSFRPQLIGLEARQHTGWLEVGGDGAARYAPHTETGYKGPPNKTLLLLLNGALAKRGVRQAAKV